MANGRRPCIRCWLILAVIALVTLALTNVWNPWPGMWAWVNQSGTLAEPAPLWQQRVGALPRTVTIAGSAVIVDRGDAVEGRALATGGVAWEKTGISWNAVAGDGAGAVVLTGELLTKGYQVLNPGDGSVLRTSTDAVGVWTYRNLVIDVRCFAAKDCVLSAFDPRGTAPRWSTDLPGIQVGLNADNPRSFGTELLTAPRVSADAAGPQPAPGLLGLPIDGKVFVVETGTGRVARVADPGREERVTTAGGRVIRVLAQSADGTCYFTVTGHEAGTGREVWRQTALNLRTTESAGCAQRSDPRGGRNVVLGVAPDRREVIVDMYDGRLLWTGDPGDRVLSVDDQFVAVHSEDGRRLRGYVLGEDRVAWSRDADADTRAAIARYAVIVVEQDPDRVIALAPASGAVLAEVRSGADVLAAGPAGLIIGDGRDIGYVPYGSQLADGGTSDQTDAGAVCTDPAQPNCGLSGK
ncbi:PQQ-binding-like beta-propeller repeat protein [Catenuloplanes indicus]|uniref:Uncharacterized protein n=1 Tax=Catenuloplanes indicus TaxID=137267 RepID=A0AAE4AZ59_9ACTN|nr:PQQ-binding-like beta-propeller repeat protein [Catenuloplanes indicus]MDQ0368089.1 hypothetical protein [Catenuloplanes indicus]